MSDEKDFQLYEKDFDDLEFADDIMFGLVMQNEDICKKVLKTLLGFEIERIDYINRQHDIKANLSSRGIKLDVFVKGSGKMFNVEMQTDVGPELSLRARYYQSLMDLHALRKNRNRDEKNASKKRRYLLLPESYVIFICKKDPYGAGIPVYTRKQICEECPEVSEKIDDKTRRVFYNASAWEKCEDSNLRSFLRYISETRSDSDLTDEIEDEVETQKKNDLLRSNYMTLQEWAEEKIEIAAEKMANQKAEQIAKQMATEMATEIAEEKTHEKAVDTARKMLAKGLSPDMISECTDLTLDEVASLQAGTTTTA